MKKLTKLGLSALCGSLASVSAVIAGEIAVTGGATATWTTLDGETTGNPLGMASNMTFTGSGELDGGQTFSIVVTNQDKSAYSAASLSLTTNNLGSFKIGSGTAAGISAYDDNSPTAWEEVWGTGITTSVNLQGGVSGSTNIQWTSPSGPAGTKLILAYAPDNNGAYNNDKTASGANSSRYGEGFDIVLDIAPDSPINLFAGYSNTWQDDTVNSVTGGELGYTENHEEGVLGLKLSFGPVSLGGQASIEALHPEARNAVQMYGNTSWGAAFNVNDNLSFSYGEMRSIKAWTGSNIVGGNNWGKFRKKREISGDSIQAAFTMGGATIKIAETDVINSAYGEGTSKEARTIALTLAF